MDGTNHQGNHAQSAGSNSQALSDAESAHGRRVEITAGIDELSESINILNMFGDTSWGPLEKLTPPAYPPSTARLCDLKITSVGDLRLGVHHRGTYLRLKSLCRASRTDAIFVVVMDEFGLAIDLNLFNFATQCKHDIQEILGDGVIFILKEPHLELVPEGENPGLRVDHPSDIIRLPSHDPRVPAHWRSTLSQGSMTASAWKAKGNASFKTFRYEKAIEHYTQALSCSPTEVEVRILKLNRAQAFLNISQYGAALSDIESAPPNDTLVEKTLARKAHALYGLSHYRECCEVLKDLGRQFPNNKASIDDLSRAIRRIMEQERGKYDFAQMSADADKLKPPHLDYATYIGPVAVKTTEGMGRGLFTTKAVKTGDLLLCEKAFAHASLNADEPPVVRINAKTKIGTEAAQIKLINLVVQKITRDPIQAAIFAELHSGSYQRVDVSEVDGAPVVDAFHVTRVVELNSNMTPGVSSKESYKHGPCTVEWFTPNRKHEVKSCGIWHMASFINHACNFNVRKSFIGDMQIVRAAQDMPADTQIFCSYIPANIDKFQDGKKILRHWGIECHCTMCEDIRATKPRLIAKRESLGEAIVMESLRPEGTTFSKMKGFVTELETTYRRPASEFPRMAVAAVHRCLVRSYMEAEQPDKIIEFSLEALTDLGFIIEGAVKTRARTADGPIVVQRWGLMLDNVISYWGALASTYASVGAPARAAQAREFAKISYRICVGEDDTFDDTIAM